MKPEPDQSKTLITPTKEIISPTKVDESFTIECETHFKKIEAFCMQDKVILCIDCILNDGHKNHEINSI
jgi:hypothetical protein